jgi:hypothetical protein
VPEVLDPSGFQISVVLRTGGNSFPLWIGGATNERGTIYHSDDPNSSLFGDIPIVESVEVEIGIGLIGKVSVQISAPYELGLQLLNSSLFAIGSVIDVQIGYPRIAKFMPWFSTMASKPSIELSPDEGLTATLNGEGGAFAAARTTSSETFSGSYASIIQQIADQDSNKWHLKLPKGEDGDESDSLYRSRENVSQGNRTDWMFVQHLCRLANCDAFIRPHDEVRGANTLQINRRSEEMRGEPRYTFVARGRSDFINTFPMLTFESSAEGVWLPPGARETRAADINIVTRETPPETVVRPEDTGVAGMPGETGVGEGVSEEEGTVVAVEGSTRDERGNPGTRVHAPQHAPESPEEVLQSLVTEARQRGGLNVTISSIGIPDLFPGEVIALSGVGIFDGNYGIESISHSAAPGDWSMTIKLLGDGLGELGVSTVLQRRWQPFNNEAAPQQEEAQSGASVEVEPTPSEE